ncbi:hypothetical protein CN128_24545 [Sinorhizobium meliloti]|uniref:hypothetical protein n=1 Tax=Rhizobium meliloti TaxID=382 RepID=UPI000FDB6D48|nr:hypothetical protein [Sinorhizobium meliloti]MDX0139344.1 hypothetical protein [Sinorhizobium meliloti]MDX0382683.1 hypothetical protein [Sinorhizobium meliloti]RVM51428.1 hypothetical protein CN128_24545 [Sinorhizobium meliloti]
MADKMTKGEREDLQREIAALEQKAFTEIERASVEAQTQSAVAGLTSEAALAFFVSLPTIEGLMPELSYQGLPAMQSRRSSSRF